MLLQTPFKITANLPMIVLNLSGLASAGFCYNHLADCDIRSRAFCRETILTIDPFQGRFGALDDPIRDSVERDGSAGPCLDFLRLISKKLQQIQPLMKPKSFASHMYHSASEGNDQAFRRSVINFVGLLQRSTGYFQTVSHYGTGHYGGVKITYPWGAL